MSRYKMINVIDKIFITLLLSRFIFAAMKELGLKPNTFYRIVKGMGL